MKIRMPDRFSTDRLRALRFHYEDAEEIFYTYASKPEATKFVSWPTHLRVQDTRDYLSFAIRGWGVGVDYAYGIRLANNRLIGSCGVVNDHGNIQFGYILSPSQWGNGYATEVCSSLMTTLRSLPEVRSIGTFIDAENTASQNVLLKCGLHVVEKRERWFQFVNQDNQVKDCILFKLP
jgi:RimJ/RimL family protein N-acetyltransferase